MLKEVIYNPKEAIIAVTLNCNSRCIMCNIWKNKLKHEIEPEQFLKLPPSLREINITGGEPFLRSDLHIIVKNIKIAVPQARLLINTNGYLFDQIKRIMPLILKEDPKICIRVSIDGRKEVHDGIRRLPNFYNKAIRSLTYFKALGIKDLGISFTLMEMNKNEIVKMYQFCKKNKYEFSLTVSTDSPIYFGEQKKILRPQTNRKLEKTFDLVVRNMISSKKPKDWLRGWFNEKLLEYMKTNKRALVCNAGKDFIYIDSYGTIFACQMKPWKITNIISNTSKNIAVSKNLSYMLDKKVAKCNDCWMVCSARQAMRSNLFFILKEIGFKKLALKFNLQSSNFNS